MRPPRPVARLACPVLLLALALARPAGAWDSFVALCTDYGGPGAVTVVQRGAPWTATPDVATLGTDPVARWHDGLLYVVNRAGGSNVQVLDPGDGWRTVRQFSLGAGRNPQDIAFAPDGAAYVSCYDQAVLLRVDPVAGLVLDEISTAPFADADGRPETGWMQAVGERLFVTVQRLDRNNWYVPTGPGLLAVYDMAARAWVDADPALPGVQGVALQGANPAAQPELAPGGARLRLGCAGWYGLADGGVEEVDLATLASRGFLVTEAALGGDVLDFAIAGPTRAFAIVSDATFATALRAWSPADGTAGAVVRPAGPDSYYPDVAWDGGGWLYLADRTPGAAGVRVYAVDTGDEQTAAAIATGLPPAWLVLPRDPALTAVAGPAAAAPLRLSCPFPNPANPATVVGLAGPAGTVVRVRVADLRGRVVRETALPLDAAGRGLFRFDGRDAAGRPASSGRYAVIAGEGAAAARAALTIVR